MLEGSRSSVCLCEPCTMSSVPLASSKNRASWCDFSVNAGGAAGVTSEGLSSSYGGAAFALPVLAFLGALEGIVRHCRGRSPITQPPEAKAVRLRHMDTLGQGDRLFEGRYSPARGWRLKVAGQIPFWRWRKQDLQTHTPALGTLGLFPTLTKFEGHIPVKGERVRPRTDFYTWLG